MSETLDERMDRVEREIRQSQERQAQIEHDLWNMPPEDFTAEHWAAWPSFIKRKRGKK